MSIVRHTVSERRAKSHVFNGAVVTLAAGRMGVVVYAIVLYTELF